MNLADVGEVNVVIEADTDNTNEDDGAGLHLLQDGGAVGVKIGFLDTTLYGNAGNTFSIGRRYASTDYPETLTINTANGNVGIGTTGPTQSLHVMAKDDSNPIRIERTDNAAQTIGVSMYPSGALSAVNPAWGYGVDNGSTMFGIYTWDGAVTGRRLVITASGDVGIGTTVPGYKLDVQGGDINASGSVRAAGVALTSDIRYKQDIEPINNALEKILNLKGVYYNWRTEEFPQKQFTHRHQLGVIAQDVEAQFPELVDTNAEGYKSVNYPALVAPLIESIKTLYRGLTQTQQQQKNQARDVASLKTAVVQKADRVELELLKAKTQKLEQENADLKTRLHKIEKMLHSK